MHASEAITGAGTYQGQQVHLTDTGPRHADVAAHPIKEGARYGRPVGRPHLTAAPEPSLGPTTLPGGIIFWTDWSEWQSATYNAGYPYQFAAYRVCLGTSYVDKKIGGNTGWCHANAGPGKQLTLGHCGYLVWYPGNEQTQADLFFNLAQVDDHFTAMIDVESWGGQIGGDHSNQITALADILAGKLSRQRVKVYGNSGDLNSIYPNRPSWLGVIKAGYSSVAPPGPWDGWQYSDGSTQWPAPPDWPRAAPPAGPSDHNAFLGTADQFRTVFGLTGGISMADIQTILDAITALRADVAAIRTDNNNKYQALVQQIGEPTHPSGGIRAQMVDVAGKVADVAGKIEALPKPLTPDQAITAVAAALKQNPTTATLSPDQIKAITDTLTSTLPEYEGTLTVSPKATGATQ